MKYLYAIVVIVIAAALFFYFKQKSMDNHTVENQNLGTNRSSDQPTFDYIVSETGSISINGAQLLFGGIAKREVEGETSTNVQIDVNMEKFIFPKEGDTIDLNGQLYHLVKFEKEEPPSIGRVFINKVEK